jgi:hypothetical protein
MRKVLPIPDPALRDDDAVEMIRVWIAEKGLHCAMNVGLYSNRDGASETGAWGIILADVARHVAMALAESGPVASRQRHLEQITSALETELANPTSPVAGKFVTGAS